MAGPQPKTSYRSSSANPLPLSLEMWLQQPSVGLVPTEATTDELPSSMQQKQPPSGLPRWEQRLSSYLLNQEISHVTFKSRCNDSRQIHPFSFDSKLGVFSADLEFET